MLAWVDIRFVDSNFTDDRALRCSGMVRSEQVNDVWKPDIFLEGTMDGVNIALQKEASYASHLISSNSQIAEWIHGE